MNRLRKWLWMLWLAGWPGIALSGPDLGHEGATEHSVVAAMVFNLLKFTDGVQAENKQIHLCFAGNDPEQMKAFQRLEGRSIRDHALSVRRLSRNASCHVTFVSARQHWKEVVEHRDSSNGLTIGGYWGAIMDGAVIEIGFEQGRPRFDVNLPEARRAQIRFQPQLLRLARQIHE